MNIEELQALLTQAEEHNKSGNYDEAEKLAHEVLAELDSATVSVEGALSEVETLRVNALLSLGTTAWRRGNYTTSLDYARQALALAEEHSLAEVTPKCLHLFGNVYLNLSDYPRALEYYCKALYTYEEIGSKSGSAIVTGNIGLVYINLSDYPRALEYLGNALYEHEELVEKSDAARVIGNIGNVFRNLSDYPRALEYYGKALDAYEELGSKSGVALITSSFGIVYWNLLDYPRALEYLGKALTAYEELRDKSGVARVTGNIGVVYMNISDYPCALEYLGKALDLHEELGEKGSIALVTGNIGNVYWNLSDYPRALEYYAKALALNEEIGNKVGITLVTMNIGSVYAIQEYEGYEPEKAEEYLFKSLSMFKELGVKKDQYEAHKSLAGLYEQEERWKESQQHFKKYHEIEKEVQSEEATKQAQLMEHRRKIEESERDRQVKLARFQEQEKILHNILPAQIAERMIAGETTIADTHKNVSVFFSDIVGFTKLSQKITAEELVGMLNGIFSQFDQLCRKHGLEKIKTIGDAYMAVSGAPTPQEHHAQSAALFALEVADMMKNYITTTGERIDIRIGLHSGTVVAGIIGENKFSYDLWGDAVNTASRMESHGEPGKIHVSEEFRNALGESSFIFTNRGEMEIKGKGIMKTYFLEK